MKILLIEDNPDDAFLIQHMSPGNEFVHCVNLKSTLEYLKLKPVDLNLIVMDLGLPDSQGEMTLDRVLAHADKTPIIILTGYVSDEIATKAARASRPILEKDTLSVQLFSHVVRGVLG